MRYQAETLKRIKAQPTRLCSRWQLPRSGDLRKSSGKAVQQVETVARKSKMPETKKAFQRPYGDELGVEYGAEEGLEPPRVLLST